MVPTPEEMRSKVTFRPEPPQPRPSNDPIIVHGVEIHPRVADLAYEFGHELVEIADAIITPEETWPGQNGESVVHLRGPIAAIAAEDTGEVIAVSTRERALQLRSQPRIGAVRRIRGGVGRRFPNDTADLLERISKAGFVVKRAERHYLITHPKAPDLSQTVPKTPSDHRSIPNTVLDIRRQFGIDLREVS